MADETGDTQEKETQDETTFTEAQQKFLDKLLGKTRIEAREKGKADAETEQEAADQEAERESMAAAAEWEKLAKHHEGRVVELEPLEAEVKALRVLISGMLKDKVKALGDVAKKFVAKLPERLSDLEKLDLLNEVEESFTGGDTIGVVGTPARKKKKPASKSTEPVESVLGKGRRFHG